MENLVLVAKINNKNTIALKQLYDFLEGQNIEYKQKLEEEWVGMRQPTYVANIAIYVNKNDLEKIQKFTEEIDNATIQSEEYSELENYTEEEQEEGNKELKKYQKRQEKLQKIMVYGTFGVLGICMIIAIVFNIVK